MLNNNNVIYNVFRRHSEKNKAVALPLAERLRADGMKVWPCPLKPLDEGGFDEWVLKPVDGIPAKISPHSLGCFGATRPPSFGSYGGTGEGLEHSRLLACPAVAFSRRWKAGTFRFRYPLKQERRFIPLHLDAAPINGSLAKILYINRPPISGHTFRFNIPFGSAYDQD